MDVISLRKGSIRSWAESDWGRTFEVDKEVSEADPDLYDALLLPGGVLNPDKLRMDERAVAFVRAFFEQGKPVGAICHGPQVLIEADVIRGKTMTSYPSVRKDLSNAGANWVDKSVVVDHGLVTSRNPGDLQDFNHAIVEVFSGRGLTTESPATEVPQIQQQQATA